MLISPVDSKDTTSPGKAPIGRAWGAERHDERWWRSSLKRTPKAGVGLKLGAEGGVIDIDVDDPEAAAPVLARIFPDGIPETMGWSNAGGRRHLLFRWDDRLARYGKAIIKGQRRADGKIIGNPKYLGLEIRIGAAEAGGKQYQSVIPPSLLKDAEARRWNEHAEILPAPPCLFADLDAHHAATVEPPSPAAIPVAPKAPRGASSRPNATDRARAFLTTCEPAVSGQGGHAKAFKVVCHLARHDLPAEVALSLLLAEWNPRCEPPWSEAELRHKVDEAYRKETRRDRKDEAAPSNGRTNGHVGGGRADGRPERNGGSGKPPADRRDGGDRPPPRPKIEITTEEHEVADLAISAVARDPDVFQRANLLMTILRDVPRGDRSILRPPGSPRITLLREPRLRELMSKSAIWLKREKDKDQLTPAHVPKWAVQALAGRGTWPDIRPIEGVTETPMLRPDGTVLDQPGYDNMMGLLYEPNAEFPTIPVNPNRDDAKNAAVALLNLVQDFPFADFTDQVAWLAGLLTPLARFAIPGPCPLFLIDANAPGTGKSKLTDIVAILSTGRAMPRTTYPDNDEEMRKRISSIAIAGDRLMLLDNIASSFGGSSLDAALTGTTWRDRILGRSEMTAELPLFTIWFATGNNVALKGDAIRRVVSCRLETREERPEERRDFAIQGDLLGHVSRHRPALVSAALTILRAYAVAGWPDSGLTPLGSYEGWCQVIRNAVHWTTETDPCDTRQKLRLTIPDALSRVAIVEGWTELADGRAGVTAADALKKVKEEPSRYPRLHEALMEWGSHGELPSSRSLGRRLMSLRGRNVGGLRFESNDDRGISMWRVETVAP